MVDYVPKYTLQLAVAFGVICLIAGCMGAPSVPTETTTVQTTETQVHAQGEIMRIIDDSERVRSVLVDDSYSYLKGKHDEANGSAVAYIETGEDSNEATGQVYEVRIDLTTESVVSVIAVEQAIVTTSQ